MKEFPRPCKNCGNMCDMFDGKLLHVYRRRERCNVIPNWYIERDGNGMPKQLTLRGYLVITDPVPRGLIEAQKLAEWEKLYSGERVGEQQRG